MDVRFDKPHRIEQTADMPDGYWERLMEAMKRMKPLPELDQSESSLVRSQDNVTAK